MSERDEPATVGHPAGGDGATSGAGATASDAGATASDGGATASGEAPPTAPEYTSAPVDPRRSDPVAALLLLVAGLAAGISLLLPWLADRSVTGLTLVKDGFGTLGDDVGDVVRTGYVQPLTIVLGGGVLFLVGLLLLIPARGHRLLGLFALLVSVAVTAAVLVPVMLAEWNLGFFGAGFWFAIAVAVLGLLGSLKALLTGRRRT